MDESTLRMLQTTRKFLGINVGFACASCSVAPNGFRRLGHLSGLLNTTGYIPLLEIQICSMIEVIRTVRMVSLMLEYSHRCTPALIVVSASGRIWYSFARNHEGHPVTRRDERDITVGCRAMWTPTTKQRMGAGLVHFHGLETLWSVSATARRSKLIRVVETVEKERRLVVEAWSRTPRNDVPLRRNVGCLRRRCGGPHEIWRCWCGFAVRVCQAFSALS